MPEISHEQPDHALAEAARGFCAKEDREDGPMVLTGPTLLHMYEEPVVGLAQEALFTFNLGELPWVVVPIERYGDRLLVQLERVASVKLAVYHKNTIFTDLENNYMIMI